ncbi:MAG: c-type cytochrome [Planctomycetes bacterium]|nr:c-type cytochrome [Planctomycetota bacterium]
MKQTIIILGLILAAGSAAFAFPAFFLGGESFQHGDASRGRRVYVQKDCVECHAVMGSGGTIGPDLAEVGKGRSHHRLVTKLWDHLPLMVESFSEEGLVWPNFTDKEMQDLGAYLFYLNFFDKPGNYNRGKLNFTGKGCVDCHSIGNSGGSVGPALDEFGSSASSLDLVARMWSHGPAMVRTQRERNAEVPKFKGTEVADLMAYLKGSSLKAARVPFQRPGNPDRGRNIFEQKQCALCHAVRGEGGGEIKGPDLVDVDLNKSVPEIAGVLWNHGPLIWDTMVKRGAAIPPFTVDEIADLLAYLFYIDYEEETGDAKKGEQLFNSRSCGDCHLEAKEDDNKAPIVSQLSEVVKHGSFAAALWNHGPRMLESMDEELIAWPKFSEDEMRNLTFFLRQSYVEVEDEEEDE